jgi:hypothetical protein
MRKTYNSVLQVGSITGSMELTLTLTPTTLAVINTTNSWSIYGVAMTGGNLDGTMVTIMSGPTGNGFTITDRNTLASALNRFSNPSNAMFTISTGGSATYIYDSVQGLWVNLGRTR